MASGRGPARPDVLARVDATGETDKDVELMAGLPQAFLSRARGGAGASAHRSWARLVAWLDEHYPETQDAAGGGDAAAKVRHELDRAIRGADDLQKLEAVGRRVSTEMLRGTIDRLVGPMLTAQLKEQRQLLVKLDEQRRMIDARKPVTVHVVWASDWRRKAAANQAEEDDA